VKRFAAAFFFLLGLSACDRPPAEVSARGRVLQLTAGSFQRVAEIAFKDGGGIAVVRPQTPGNILLVSKLSISNMNAGLASLLIDEKAVAVVDVAGAQARMINPWQRREKAQTAPATTDSFMPFLWGASDLQENYSLTGWVIFELPAAAKVRSLIWNQVEDIRLFFPDEPV
jgi:hypothetical protein